MMILINQINYWNPSFLYKFKLNKTEKKEKPKYFKLIFTALFNIFVVDYIMYWTSFQIRESIGFAFLQTEKIPSLFVMFAQFIFWGMIRVLGYTTHYIIVMFYCNNIRICNQFINTCIKYLIILLY